MDPWTPWLQCSETGAPFSHCIHCRMPLLELDQAWLINKDYHHGECTLEYAICSGCRDLISEGFSKESRAAIREFIEQEIPWQERIGQYLVEPRKRLEACIVCEKSRRSVPSFAISALFDSSGRITEGPLPLLICGTCSGRMTERLSSSTREAWQRFLNDHFDSPPRDSSLPGML
ncbi:MAG TPA: hypothetical protein VFY13_04105 [Luteolibacter sp.]|nr:hypothetical protein [Luteolibacter sp.]